MARMTANPTTNPTTAREGQPMSDETKTTGHAWVEGRCINCDASSPRPWAETCPMTPQHPATPEGESATEGTAGERELLTVEQANELVGEDIMYHLENPFIPPDLIAQKVCFWLAAVRREAGDERAEQIAQALPEAFADRVTWGDGTEYIAVTEAQRIARAARMGGDS